MTLPTEVQTALDDVEKARTTFHAADQVFVSAHNDLTAATNAQQEAKRARNVAETDLNTKRAAATKALHEYWAREPEAHAAPRRAARPATKEE